MATEPAVEQPTETTALPITPRNSSWISYRTQWELILLLVVGVIGAISALAGAPIVLRLIFGLPLIVFIPGYALATTLFPSNEGLDGLERIALGFGLSLAIIPLLALGIEYSPWRLELRPIVGGLLSLSFILTGTAFWRRSRLSKDLCFVAEIPKPSLPPISTWSGSTRIAAGLLIVALLVFGGSSAALIVERLRANPSTEFAIYNDSGQAAFYPRDFTAGQAQHVQLQIENHEGKDVNYSLTVVAGTTTVGTIDSIHIDKGHTWRRPVTIKIPPALSPTEPGQPLALEFNLYRGSAAEAQAPYRSLRLFANVEDQPSTP